jgi:arabinofuranan 3-O-arabinosyltransferase
MQSGYTEWIRRLTFAFAVTYAAVLAASSANGIWLIDSHGHGIQTDFVNFWAAGRLATDGNAAAAYDWVIHKAVQEQGVNPFEGYLSWTYPPIFLFLAAPLSFLPYVPAFLTWLTFTFVAYVAVIRFIVADRIGLFLACAFPAVLWNAANGQNGFLTAALLGGALASLERHPIVSGVFIGLLSYKPQFGLLFPLALVAAGQWRAFSAATLTTLSLIAASWLVFESDAWAAFFHSLPLINEAVLSNGLPGFQKLQTIFGIVRFGGGSEALAWTLQGILIAVCILFVLRVWSQRQIVYEVKAAALGTAVLLATPYLYIYDLVALAVPMVFLIRSGLRDGFPSYEIGGLVVASVLILIFPLWPSPTGLLATLLVAFLIIRRVKALFWIAHRAIQSSSYETTVPCRQPVTCAPVAGRPV